MTKRVCDECVGTGWRGGQGGDTCEYCNGTGVQSSQSPPVINRITRENVRSFSDHCEGSNTLDVYQSIATRSAIYPGQGTPFGLMYAALGLAEAGEVQNKVKKAFRDDWLITFAPETTETDHGRLNTGNFVTSFKDLSPERKAQIRKELGGVFWYIAATCNEIGATMSEVALENLEELCSRGERGTLRGSGDER